MSPSVELNIGCAQVLCFYLQDIFLDTLYFLFVYIGLLCSIYFE